MQFDLRICSIEIAFNAVSASPKKNMIALRAVVVNEVVAWASESYLSEVQRG